jgi:hypothetical protein
MTPASIYSRAKKSTLISQNDSKQASIVELRNQPYFKSYKLDKAISNFLQAIISNNPNS